MGPAFYLSLFEMSWGQKNRQRFDIVLKPDEKFISAYPSFQFRLDFIRKIVDIKGYCNELDQIFMKQKNVFLKSLPSKLESITLEKNSDTVNVYPTADPDCNSIEIVLGAKIIEIKNCLVDLLEVYETLFSKWYSKFLPDDFVKQTSELLVRLENNILPNIIPDETLCGKPADFAPILNASSLYRLGLLIGDKKLETEDLTRRKAMIERLTAKAFEVSFMQRNFNDWQKGVNDGSSG